jgi:DNA-binding HxlR family transcriptional regulator
MATTTMSIRQRALESRDAVELLSSKWRIAILHLLRDRARRTGELQRGLDVSPKVLTQTLKSMERDGLIERTVFAAVPPRVEYCLTDMGSSVLVPLRELCLWAKAHRAGRDAARRRYDAVLAVPVGSAKEAGL